MHTSVPRAINSIQSEYYFPHLATVSLAINIVQPAFYRPVAAHRGGDSPEVTITKGILLFLRITVHSPGDSDIRCSSLEAIWKIFQAKSDSIYSRLQCAPYPRLDTRQVPNDSQRESDSAVALVERYRIQWPLGYHLPRILDYILVRRSVYFLRRENQLVEALV